MITKYNIFESVDGWIDLLDYLNENDLKNLNKVTDAYKYRDSIDNNIAVKEHLSYMLKGKLIKIHYDNNYIEGEVPSEISFGSNQPFINISNKEDRLMRFRTIDFCTNPNMIQVYSEIEKKPRVRWFKHGKLQNDTLNEYVEFVPVKYEYGGYYGGKDVFRLQNYAKMARIGLLQNFLKSGDWYRIRFNDYKHIVIKIEQIRYGGDVVSIGYFMEYNKGEIRGSKNGHSVIVIDTWKDDRDIVIEHIEPMDNILNRRKFRELNIQVGDNVKVSNPGLEDKIFKITSVNKEEHSYFSKSWTVSYPELTKKNHKILPIDIVENLGRDLINKELDPYGEEVWESKKSKKRNATRIKMAEIDPYGEEDWGWDVKINDDDFKDKYIVFKKKFLGSYDYYFAFLTSHYQILSFGGSQDLNIIKKHQVLSPISEREIERIKKDKIELVPYHWVGKYSKNEFGNSERMPYSSLKKDVLFLDQDYMDNYLYMNESVNEEYVEFNKTGEELELKRWHNYFEDYIVPFLRKGEWYRIICEIPYDKNDYDVLERPGKENKLITKRRKKMLLYVFRFHSTHSDWAWDIIQCDRMYKHGEIEEVNPFKDYIQMDRLRNYQNVKIQHIVNPEINRKREEMRLRLHPNDPYGEEEWND